MPDFAYVSCNAGKAIDVFSVHAPGQIEKIQSVELSGRGLPLALSPDGRRIYASVIGEKDGEEENRIDAFTIDRQSSRLTFLSSTVVAVRMAHISVDRTGNFLLCASFPSHKVAVYPIGSRGMVSPQPTYWRDAPLNAHQILVDPGNQFCFVSCLGDHQVMQLIFDQQTGTFADNDPPLVQLQNGAGCRQVAFHPNRRFVYLLNERDGTLFGYTLDAAKGTLHEIFQDCYTRTGLQGEPWGSQIHVSPDGGRLFAADRRGNSLTSWTLNGETGLISNRHIVDCGANPRGFDITSNGKSMILGAMDDDKLEIFDIQDAQTPPKLTATVPTSPQPGWVEILQA